MAIDIGFGSAMKIFIMAYNLVKSVFPILWNFLTRPSLQVDVSSSPISFEGAGKKYCPSFSSIIVKNIGKSDLVFDLGSVEIGNESIGYVIQQNLYFSRTLEGARADLALTTNDEILTNFKENWIGPKLHILKPHHTFSIPLFPQKMSSNLYFHISDNAKFYFKKKKIKVTLKIDSINYDYSVNRVKMLRLIIDDLISNFSMKERW